MLIISVSVFVARVATGVGRFPDRATVKRMEVVPPAVSSGGVRSHTHDTAQSVTANRPAIFIDFMTVRFFLSFLFIRPAQKAGGISVPWVEYSVRVVPAWSFVFQVMVTTCE
jgi:hypothetical protein